MRLEKVLKEMQKRQLTHLIINDPSSIDYLINYKNNPGERMYLLLLSSDGHHKLFMNMILNKYGIVIQIIIFNYLQMNLMEHVLLESIRTFQQDS